MCNCKVNDILSTDIVILILESKIFLVKLTMAFAHRFWAPPWGFCLHRLSPPWGICSCSKTKWLMPKQMLWVGWGGWICLELTEPYRITNVLGLEWYEMSVVLELQNNENFWHEIFNEVINNLLFLFIPWFSWWYLLRLNCTWNLIFSLNLIFLAST